jgi:hypothetical protein
MKQRQLVLRRRATGGHDWVDLVDQDTNRVMLSVQMPAGGLSMDDIERFREHLLKLAKDRPS